MDLSMETKVIKEANKLSLGFFLKFKRNLVQDHLKILDELNFHVIHQLKKNTRTSIGDFGHGLFILQNLPTV